MEIQNTQIIIAILATIILVIVGVLIFNAFNRPTEEKKNPSTGSTSSTSSNSASAVTPDLGKIAATGDTNNNSKTLNGLPTEGETPQPSSTKEQSSVLPTSNGEEKLNSGDGQSSRYTDQYIPKLNYVSGLRNFDNDTITVDVNTFPYNPNKLPVTLPLLINKSSDVDDGDMNMLETGSKIQFYGQLHDLIIEFLDADQKPHEFISINHNIININNNKQHHVGLSNKNDKELTLEVVFESDNTYSIVVDIDNTISHKIFDFDLPQRSFIYINGKVKKIDVPYIKDRV